jgi:hypothetical protein
MQSIVLRTFGKLKYRDPRPFLVRLRKFGVALSASATAKRIGNLRTNQLKPDRELREAAIFCYLVGQRIGTKVGLAPGEEQDYDFVAAWTDQNQTCYAPVQLKELPPEATAPGATLQGIISDLGQYTSSGELVVAIHLNREITFNTSALPIPPLGIAELWAFGATTQDQNTWALWGDLLRSPTVSYHAYPAA